MILVFQHGDHYDKIAIAGDTETDCWRTLAAYEDMSLKKTKDVWMISAKSCDAAEDPDWPNVLEL